MNILILGGGGREHALAWKIAQSPKAKTVIVAPGNAGTMMTPKVRNSPAKTVAEYLNLAQQEKVDLTIVGPETPLAEGVVDQFRQHGLRIFGADVKSAQLETSKDFAKNFMRKFNIPTADYRTFNNAQLAHEHIEQKNVPIVIKADGLAAGKGVVVAMTLTEAHLAIDDMLSSHKLGVAGNKLIIEDFLLGEEVSFIVMVDGKNILPLATSQDHKRLKNGDQGPNTGGMGAYSPAPFITPLLHDKIMREVINPTIQGLAKMNIHYTGFLYAGLMIAPDNKIQVLEFNVRMGDPETQAILMRLKTDVVTLFSHGVSGNLDQLELEWDKRYALTAVIASEGYPESPRLGDEIHGLTPQMNFSDPVQIFHAGTIIEDGRTVTSGGRVLGVTALGNTLQDAKEDAYRAIRRIQFAGMQYRTDIAYRALKSFF